MDVQPKVSCLVSMRCPQGSHAFGDFRASCEDLWLAEVAFVEETDVRIEVSGQISFES